MVEVDGDLDALLTKYWNLEKAKCSKSYLEFKSNIFIVQELRNITRQLKNGVMVQSP